VKRALPILLALLCASCATSDGVKGAALVKFAPAGITDDAAKPKRIALLVGIDAFEDERFPDLRYAAEDANAVGRSLASGFDEVRVLSTPEQTRRTAILSAIAEIGAQASNTRDTILLYFSTHGSLGRKPGGELERYLVTADTRMNLLTQTGISVDGLLEVVDALPSQRKLVVLATCHSGKGKSQVDDGLAKALAALKSASPAPLEEVSEATIILTASAFGDTARESEALGHDIYTHFFLESLDVSRGDRDGNGAVTASEAHDYARDKTYAFTKGQQRPTAESAILGRDPIVLSGEPQRLGRPVLFSYAASADGLQLCIDGAVKGVLPGGIAVPEGDHELTLSDAHSGETVYSGAIAVQRGEVIEISKLLPDPVQWTLQVGGLADWPILATVRGEYLPYSFGARLGARVRNWPAQGWVLGLDVDYRGGKGRAGGFNETLPFEFHAIGFDASAGYAWDLAQGLFLTPGVSVGASWAFRRFDTSKFRKDEDLTGFRFGADLALEWEMVEGFWLVPQLEAGGLVAGLGQDLGPHPYVGAVLSAGMSF